LGHKLLGTIGVNAGTQAEPGLYVVERLVYYDAKRLRERSGRSLPISGLDVDAVGNVLGVSFTAKLARGPYYSLAVGAPLARISVNADDPHLAIDAAGFGDLFVQPMKLGAHLRQLDLVGGYAFYAPTGRFEPGGSVGRGYWTHELSAGGALHFGQDRTARASLLASYDFNGPKREIDVERGDTFQMQGGAGMRVNDLLDAGIALFALWQVTDNDGSDLPDVIRGARTRAFGVGPEVSATLTALRLRIDVRAEWELGVRTRQDGWILVTSASFVAWRPGADAAASEELVVAESASAWSHPSARRDAPCSVESRSPPASGPPRCWSGVAFDPHEMRPR
jgi:hypothetical protein